MRQSLICATNYHFLVSIPKGAIMSRASKIINESSNVSIPKGAIMSLICILILVLCLVSIPKGAIMR